MPQVVFEVAHRHFFSFREVRGLPVEYSLLVLSEVEERVSWVVDLVKNKHAVALHFSFPIALSPVQVSVRESDRLEGVFIAQLGFDRGLRKVVEQLLDFAAHSPKDFRISLVAVARRLRSRCFRKALCWKLLRLLRLRRARIGL